LLLTDDLSNTRERTVPSCKPSVVLILGQLLAAVPAHAAGPVAPASASKAETKQCPARDPKKFAMMFADRIELQKKFVEFPLKYTYRGEPKNPEIEAFSDETVMANTYRDIPYIKSENDPVVPTKSRRLKEKMDFKSYIERGGDLAIRVSFPDTDDITIFHLRSRDGCWYLYWIESLAL
jgi:hypothetical protein